MDEDIDTYDTYDTVEYECPECCVVIPIGPRINKHDIIVCYGCFEELEFVGDDLIKHY